jgi:hypothetical protein
MSFLIGSGAVEVVGNLECNSAILISLEWYQPFV